MTTIAERFLTTEQAANALLDELENLKAETQHYSTASMALDAAGRSLSSLAGDTADLAARVRDLVLASREIGTERLLEGLDRLTTRGAEQKEKLQELDDLVRHAAETASAAGAAIVALAAAFQHGHAETDRKIGQAQDLLEGINGALATADRKIDAAHTALTQLQGQSDTLASSVNGLGLKLDGAAAATER